MGAACPARFGFYNPATREILANLGLGVKTLSHELVHPIVESDFPDAPTCLDQGIGSLFEKPVFPSPGEVHGATNWRLPRLKAALRSMVLPRRGAAHGATTHYSRMRIRVSSTIHRWPRSAASSTRWRASAVTTSTTCALSCLVSRKTMIPA
jgi:hypothetical protein